MPNRRRSNNLSALTPWGTADYTRHLSIRGITDVNIRLGTTRGFRTFATFAVIGGLVPAASAQSFFPEENGVALAGVQAFDASVRVLTWLAMDGDRELFMDNADSDFVLALRRDGVRVEPSAPNYLFCEIKLAGLSSSSLVAYSWSIAFYDFTSDGLHALQWTTGGIVTVGRNNFTAESAIEGCADAFASERLRWNPR